MALLPATSARRVSRLTCISNDICTLCTRRRPRTRAPCAMPSVRIRRSWNCTWPRTTTANRFRARSAARTLRANTIWIVIWSSRAAIRRARSSNCRAMCATRCSRGWTICVSICACTWGSRPGVRSTSVRSVRRSSTGRRC